MTPMACVALEGVSYPADRAGLQAQLGVCATRPRRRTPLDQDATPLMPWNDNANPGPWGPPPPDDERREPQKRPDRDEGPSGNRGPRKPESPDLGAGVEELKLRARRYFGRPGGGIRPGAVGLVIAVI